jgi:hypothetical protein
MMIDRAGRWITEQVGRCARSVAEVARELGCDWDTATDWVLDHGQLTAQREDLGTLGCAVHPADADGFRDPADQAVEKGEGHGWRASSTSSCAVKVPYFVAPVQPVEAHRLQDVTDDAVEEENAIGGEPSSSSWFLGEATGRVNGSSGSG